MAQRPRRQVPSPSSSFEAVWMDIDLCNFSYYSVSWYGFIGQVTGIM